MSGQEFETSEGLRLLLLDLAYAGPFAWEDRPEAAALMTYAMEKYGALARKHGLEPSDAAVAAFEAMRARATRLAEDPWAVITHAVQLTLIYESRAQGILCSAGQARKATGQGWHDAERFGDRESDLADYHPAFHVHNDLTNLETVAGSDEEEVPTNAYFALDEAVALFVASGWPPRTARLGLEIVGSQLTKSGNRLSAFEALRRDLHGPAQLDISHASWVSVLRVALGHQHPDRVNTAAGRGVLLRLLIGETPDELYADEDLIEAIQAAAPRVGTVGEGHV